MKKLISLFGFLLISALSYAQGFGTLSGTVADSSGAVVASAQIVVTEVDTGVTRTATSNSEGHYVLSSLRPTDYKLTIRATGFHTFVVAKIALQADQSATVNAALEAGGQEEIVDVTGVIPQVDTTTATMKQVIDQQRMTELPLNGRNPAELSLLVAGTVSIPSNPGNPTGTYGGGALQGATKTFPGAVAIVTNGSRQNQVSYMLDGGNNVDEYTNTNQPFPMPDALQEFSVQTSNYNAQYGQNAGGVVNIITKTGGNQFHGDAFDFLRSANLNAKPWQSLGPKDALHRNQFGGTIGGPIIHDKTFFFAAVQSTIQNNVLAGSKVTVPTAAQRATATDPAVINVLNGIPVPASGTSIQLFRPDQQRFDEGTGKIDHIFSQKDSLTLRYFVDYFNRNAVFNPSNLLLYSDGSTITAQNALIHETHIFSNSLLNEFRLGYSRDAASRGPASNAENVKDFGVNIPFQPPVKAIQAIRVAGAFTIGDNPTGAFTRNNYSLSDDLNWVHGKHTVQFGGQFERSLVDLNNKFFQPAEFTFLNLTNFLKGDLTDQNGNTPGFRQGAGEFKNNRGMFAGLYVHDTYKLTRRLTVNFGVRYEPAIPWHENRGEVEQFRLSGLMAGVKSTVFPNAPAGLYFPGDPGVPENGIGSTLNKFAPRAGFALDLFGDGKTSLRGGAGMFFDTRIPGIINNRFADVTPFSPQFILSTAAGAVQPGSFADPLCVNVAATSAQIGHPCVTQTNPFPATFPPPANSAFGKNLLVVSWDPNNGNYQVPTLYNWNLSIERQLPADILLRAAYVGSHGSHLKETLFLNPSQYLNSFAGAGIYGSVTQDAQDINSNYNSLQLSFEKRMSHNFTLLANYTWSKSLDDLPAGGGVADIGSDQPSALPFNNPGRHAFDYGPSDFDHTHRFVLSYVWQLPSLKEANSWIRGTFGDWQFSGLMTAMTGRPLTVLAGANNSGTGIGNDRATLSGNPYGPGACARAGVTGPCVDLLNPASFATTGTLGAPVFGNVGKGEFRFPGFYDWDMSLLKSFSLSERWKLQLRGEFFNIFNRVNYLSDETTLANFDNFSSKGNFGAIQQASDPRIGQVALKILF